MTSRFRWTKRSVDPITCQLKEEEFRLIMDLVGHATLETDKTVGIPAGTGYNLYNRMADFAEENALV